MTGIVKTDQLQGAQGTTITIPTGNKISIADSATVGTLNATTMSGTPIFSGNVTLPSINGGQIGGRRNIAYNGAMNIAQRSTSLTGQGAYPGGYLTVDRWKFVTNNSAGRFTDTQEAITDLPGFANCTKMACTTADTSIASGEYLMFSQYFEGQDVQQLKKGTSEAEKFTLSFYVKGNANATYTAEFSDADNTRHNSQEFSVTTSWNRVSLTYDGDTTGALDDDSNVSFRLFIWLHAGSDYTGGTFSSNTWQATNNQRVSDNQTSFYDSTDRTFFITGVQIEVGSQATPFEHKTIGEELRLCSRYYWRQYNSGSNVIYFRDNISASGQNILYQFPAPPAMRINAATVTCTLTENVNSQTLTYHQHGTIAVYWASVSGDNYLYSEDLSIDAEL